MKLSSNCEQAGSYNINQRHQVLLYHQKGFDHNSIRRCLISYKLIKRLRQKITVALLMQPASLSMVRDGVWPYSKQCLSPRLVKQGAGNGCGTRFIYLCRTPEVLIESGCRILSSFYPNQNLLSCLVHNPLFNYAVYLKALFFLGRYLH